MLVLATGCAQCAPDRVGPGVARLTVRNVGAMVAMTNADTSCGFSSAGVLGNPTQEGDVGGDGSITYTVSDCTIDAGDELDISRSCTDTVTTVRGKFTISATRKITGKLTGNPNSPIIPGGPDAVTITISKATFEKFVAETSTSENRLKMLEGSLSAVVKPRLAVSASSGACAIATPNVTFSDIKYEPSTVFVQTPDNKFEADVQTSNIAAQNGVNGDNTNTLSGTISVFGSEVPAIQNGDTDGLDPDFDAAKFEEGYACTKDLAQPVTYTCADLRPKLAGGVARLSVRTLGTIASLVDANTSCGFSSTAVAGAPTMTGTLGRDDATATFTISSACSITLPANTTLSSDCNGAITTGSGTISVTGTKKVSGWRTGNPLKPIVPNTPQPAIFDLTVTFTNFEVKSSASTSSMLIKSGTLSGKVEPRTAIDKTTGACSVSTPVATFAAMSWTNGSVRLNSDGNNFNLAVGASTLNAQNGTRGTETNIINGAVTVDGQSYTIANEPLDTAFDPVVFKNGYTTCKPNTVIPPVDAACSFKQALGTGAARLLVKNLATATSMANGNTTCGFSNTTVLQSPTNVMGSPGSQGSVTWSVNACAMGPLPANTTISTNCLGTQSKAGGTVTATGTKTVTGMRATNPPIVPVTREAATFTMSSMVFSNFELFDLPTGATTPATSSILNGTASVTVKPVGGESNTNAGVYSISTPVAKVETLTMSNGTLTMKSDGNTFVLTIGDVALNAFNGSYLTNSNNISGSITVDGQPVTLAPTQLDPAFAQATFDSTYVCTPDLKAVIPYP